ncbi:MAG: CPBP family intramembrane glutamic endopeptidase [Planctomycetota bacterium]
MSDRRPPSRARAVAALVLLVPVPSVAVAWAANASEGASADAAGIFYVASKVWLLALPFGWHFLVDRRSASLSPTSGRRLAVGALLGLAIAALILGVRHAIGTEWLDGEVLRANLARLGVDTRASFVVMAVLLSLGNSLMEEIVWRWFVVEKCVEALPDRAGGWAVPLSAAFFTAHHVFALDAHFTAPIVALASVGVFVGGWIWSALYRRTGSIWPSWISHLVVDAALMWIGYDLLFGTT